MTSHWPEKYLNFARFDRADQNQALKIAYVCLTCSQALLFNGTEGIEVGPELRIHEAIHVASSGTPKEKV